MKSIDDLAVYPIRTAAKVTEIDPRRIRSWETLGLIVPSRTPGGHRLFSQRDMTRLRRIKELVDEHGVQLQAVGLLLDREEVSEAV